MRKMFHMWDGMTFKKRKDSLLFKNIKDKTDFYFVHSYYFNVKNKNEISTSVNFLNKQITASVEKKNIFGVQFHPEKSLDNGLKILKKFLRNLMLKKRIIPTLLLKNQRLVKGRKFSNYRDTGDPVSAIKIYNSQDVDELIFVNIDENRFESTYLEEVLSLASENCFFALTAGGGINKISQIEKLLNSGADKVIICSEYINNPKFIFKASEIFGSQCIVLGVDIRRFDNDYYAHINLGKEK